MVNPWFSITKNALSDLGGGNLINNGHPAPALPEIYNFGLIIEGILIALLSSLFILFSENKIEDAGSSFFIISGLFLALIGIYHEGTYPHDFVSIWFFILSSISYITIGIALVIQRIKYGIAMLVLIPVSWLLFIKIPWQSVAENEIFGIIIIEVLVILYMISIRNRRYKLYKAINK
ncbi:DUF998 domain-containing protein [Picrophilus oshimae]|uniref:DUF998 domain-containing protein n=1 Tax=Picrophilus oshimae TaxID=46632 RepID=UPI0012933EEF|nr:DUF998 domain-containing protein [Picrophilus oshimae]